VGEAEGGAAGIPTYHFILEGVEQVPAGILERHRETEEEVAGTLVRREESEGEVVGILGASEDGVEEAVGHLLRSRFSGKSNIMNLLSAAHY
jgi:hypothetical protein